jgi:hypothetical protein
MLIGLILLGIQQLIVKEKVFHPYCSKAVNLGARAVCNMSWKSCEMKIKIHLIMIPIILNLYGHIELISNRRGQPNHQRLSPLYLQRLFPLSVMIVRL